MIDLTAHKDPARVLKNACEPGINPPGTHLLYHEGDWFDQIGTSKVGAMAMALYQQGKVRLVQKIVHQEPRRYCYYAVTR